MEPQIKRPRPSEDLRATLGTIIDQNVSFLIHCFCSFYLFFCFIFVLFFFSFFLKWPLEQVSQITITKWFCSFSFFTYGIRHWSLHISPLSNKVRHVTYYSFPSHRSETSCFKFGRKNGRRHSGGVKIWQPKIRGNDADFTTELLRKRRNSIL